MATETNASPMPSNPFSIMYFLCGKRKRSRARILGRNEPGDYPGAMTGGVRGSRSSSRLLPGVKPPWRKISDERKK
jgi:hypothetical protein